MAILKIYSKRMRREPFGNTTTRTITVMHDEAPITGATVVYVLNADAKGNHQSHKAFAVKEDALKYADELLQHSLKEEGFELLPDPV
jgi:hypothetical protein